MQHPKTKAVVIVIKIQVGITQTSCRPLTTRHVLLLFKLKPAKLKDLLLFVGTTFPRRRLPRPSTSRAGALCLEVGDIFAV